MFDELLLFAFFGLGLIELLFVAAMLFLFICLPILALVAVIVVMKRSKAMRNGQSASDCPETGSDD